MDTSAHGHTQSGKIGSALTEKGIRMTDRKTLVNDMAEMETLLLDLEDVTPCGYSEKRCVLAICRCLWHILEYLIRRDR